MCVTLCMSVAATNVLAFIIIHLRIDGEIDCQRFDTVKSRGIYDYMDLREYECNLFETHMSM